MTTNIRSWSTSIEIRLLRITDAINSRGRLFVGVIGIVYLFMAFYRAKRKLFWFDEIFTLYISRLPDFTSLVDVLKHGVDFNPPLFYEWIIASSFFFKNEHIGARVPSIIGVGILCLSLYRFVSIRSSAIGGLVAGLFPLVTGVLYYSYEARSHGIVIGFAGLALVCWQSAIDPKQAQRRIYWLIGLGIALMCATLSHGYALVIFAPLVLAELYRYFVDKKIDWPAWGTLALSSTTILVPYWQMHIAKSTFPPTFFPASLMMLGDSYLSNLGYGLPIVGLVIGLVLYKFIASKYVLTADQLLAGPTRVEWVACLGFAAIPFFVYFLSKLTGAPQVARYSLSCVIGFAALLGSFAARKPVIGLCLTMLMACLVVFDFINYARSTFIIEPSTSIRLSTYNASYAQQYKILLEETDHDSPIVIIDSNTLIYPTIVFYAPPSLRQRLTALIWDARDINYLAYSRLIEFSSAQGQVVNGDDFIKSHKTFYVFTSFPSALNRWIKRGGTVTLLNSISGSLLFSVRLP